MGLIGKLQHFLVATAVAIGYYPEIVALVVEYWQLLLYASHLFLTIAVGSEKAACKQSCCISLYLGAYHLEIGVAAFSQVVEERSHPIVDACAHHTRCLAIVKHLAQLVESLQSQQTLVVTRKPTAHIIKVVERHALEVPGKKTFLGSIVGVELQLHQYQERTEQRKT